jgi:hypothetical protein
MDVSLGETSLHDLVEALDLPERAAQALASQGEAGGPSRGFDVVGHLFKKYGNLLTAADWVYLEPIPQHDWLAIFRVPWIRGQLS